MRNSLIPTALFVIISSVVSLDTQAVALNRGDDFTITPGQALYDEFGDFAGIGSGSYYAMDTNLDGQINNYEKVALAQGTIGLKIGSIGSPGAFHPGAPTPSDTNTVTAQFI